MMKNLSSNVDLSVVMPAYGEEKTIQEALTRLHGVLREAQIIFEIVLVVDGNVDQTKERAQELTFENLTVISYPTNRGKGFALRYGTNFVHGTYTAFLDADLDIDCTCLVHLYNKLIEEEADVVVGSKVHRDSVVIYPRFRRFQSALMRVLVRILFSLDIGDTQTGIKVFKTPVLLSTISKVETDGFSFDVDLLTQLHDRGSQIIEGPIILDFQFASTTSFLSGLEVLRDLFILWRRRLKRKHQS